ncbi:multidrug effflux MFS transporter [Aestuariispira insulae]|uniref:Bcr/CflA family efflux transporter n=1 Tax=Aestuariispira insulae TaxID=1461337 RepID=A0A3D9HI00_9PROT|nr:multidrug effflux MFS transporter [Aestuariispira insulae]RED48586.1 DHA1 family bicyclomycin/chloramphenicol resistance-like MFS transporter [Aestuariispira insulae]
MSAETRPSQPGDLALGEFVTLMAVLISLIALSIDAMLPALAMIGEDLGVAQANDTQMVVTSLFLGLGVGTLFYGPLSDSIGRKPSIYLGLIIFILGSVVSIIAPTFEILLAGRVLQGFGAAGPRIVTMALVRDQYEGRAMARIMSLVMAVFIIVPALAPLVGQGILYFAGWRSIFTVLLGLALVGLVWFGWRQPETLPKHKRVAFSLTRLGGAVWEVLSNRMSAGYTVASGLIFGAFVGYLSTAPQIFQGRYGLGDQFPYYFGALALAIGGASLVNARLVMRLGMRRLSWISLIALTLLSCLFFVIGWQIEGGLPLSLFMAYMLMGFFCIGILFGNFNALAIEPLGHIAGVASAVIGSVQSFVSILFGYFVGQAFDGTALPLVGGFAILGIAAILMMAWTERGQKS